MSENSLIHAATHGCLSNAIAVRNSDGHREYAIGRIKRSFSSYREGDFVLFEWEEGPINPLSGLPDSGSPLMTVEMPMTPEAIADQVERGSLIKTWLTMVHVPCGFVEHAL